SRRIEHRRLHTEIGKVVRKRQTENREVGIESVARGAQRVDVRGQIVPGNAKIDHLDGRTKVSSFEDLAQADRESLSGTNPEPRDERISDDHGSNGSRTRMTTPLRPAKAPAVVPIVDVNASWVAVDIASRRVSRRRRAEARHPRDLRTRPDEMRAERDE